MKRLLMLICLLQATAIMGMQHQDQKQKKGKITAVMDLYEYQLFGLGKKEIKASDIKRENGLTDPERFRDHNGNRKAPSIQVMVQREGDTGWSEESFALLATPKNHYFHSTYPVSEFDVTQSIEYFNHDLIVYECFNPLGHLFYWRKCLHGKLERDCWVGDKYKEYHRAYKHPNKIYAEKKKRFLQTTLQTCGALLAVAACYYLYARFFK